jgi:hypothetical protein
MQVDRVKHEYRQWISILDEITASGTSDTNMEDFLTAAIWKQSLRYKC